MTTMMKVLLIKANKTVFGSSKHPSGCFFILLDVGNGNKLLNYIKETYYSVERSDILDKLVLSYKNDKGLCPSCNEKLKYEEEWDRLFDSMMLIRLR